MQTLRKRSLVFGILAIACCATSALADIQMTLTGQVNPTGAVMGGVYTSPYDISVGTGSSSIVTLLTCDDFRTEIAPGQTWTATTTTLSEILYGSTPSTKVKFDNDDFDKQKLDYATVAFLASDLMSLSNFSDPKAGLLSYAIWSVFDTELYQSLNNNNGATGYGSLNGSQVGEVDALLNGARSAAQTAIGTGNFGAIPYITIYTPTTGQTSQEFIGVPEPAAIVILMVNLLVIAGLILFRRLRAA